LFPLFIGRVDLGLREIPDLAVLLVLHLEDTQVLVGHRPGQSLGAAFQVGQVFHLLGQGAHQLLGDPLELPVGLQLDGLGIANRGIGSKVNFIAAERDDRRPAVRRLGNPGDRMHLAAFQFRDGCGKIQAWPQHAPGRIDLEDDQVRSPRHRPADLPLNVLFELWLNGTIDRDADGAGSLSCDGGLAE